MTVYSMTMSSTIRTFGGAPTDKWAAYNWNAFKWGEGTTAIPMTVRLLVNTTNLTVASTAAVNWRYVHLLAGETITPAAANNINFMIGIVGGTVTPAELFEHGYVQDPNNYYRVFPEGVTDLTLRSTPVWTSASSAAAAWSTAVAATTVWS